MTAAAIKTRLHALIEDIPDYNLEPLLEVIEEQYIQDDIPTRADLEAIRKGREEYERGETLLYEDIDWDT